MTSLILSAIALAIMAGLIVARWVSERRQSVIEEERRRLVPLLLAVPRSDERFDDAPPASPLLTELSVELIQLVRGAERQGFVASAGRLGVPQRLRAQLAHGRARQRLAAAEALADFADPLTETALVAALEDRHADVRLAAAAALASMDRAPPAAVLVEKLRVGREEQSMLITGLFEDIARTRPDEIRALVEDPDSAAAVKAAAIEALAASGDYRLVETVMQLALQAEPDLEELPRYLRALGQFGHPGGEAAVLLHLHSPRWWIRAAAAEAAGRIGIKHVAPLLGKALDDPDWWVRFRAGEALVRLGEPGHRMLVEASRCGGELARQTAALTLAERGIRP